MTALTSAIEPRRRVLVVFDFEGFFIAFFIFGGA